MNLPTSNTPSKPTQKKYTRRSRAQWQELINNFEHSDLTLEAYCQQHNIASSGFYHWRKRLESELTPDQFTDSLIDITQSLNDQSVKMSRDTKSWQVELELGNGCILRINAV